MQLPADSENDWIIVCVETTEFVIEFTDEKVSSRSATFHPAVKSKDLTLERFRELEDGMTREEVQKLFGDELIPFACDWRWCEHRCDSPREPHCRRGKWQSLGRPIQ